MVLQKIMETVKGLKPSLISSAHLARFVSKHRLRKEGKFARPLATPVAGAIFLDSYITPSISQIFRRKTKNMFPAYFLHVSSGVFFYA